MANDQTTDDVRASALWRAGEPQDATSSFWVRSLDYLNKVQQALVAGGNIAVGRDLATSAGIYAHIVGLPITDWMWARKTGVLTTTAAIQTGTVTLTQNSNVVNFSVGITPSVVGYRILVNQLPTVPVIATHISGAATATMDAVWPEVTQTNVSYTLFPDAYVLPTDFLRFATPPYSHAYWRNPISISTFEQQTTYWPMGAIWKRPPQAGYLRPAGLKPASVAFNSWDTRGYRLEYEYIAFPDALIAGSTPILPAHYRETLSCGAAMLIAFDKGDPRAKELASEFRESVAMMVQEWRRALSGGSSIYGQFKCRAPWYRLRSLQPMGELFLV